MQEIQDILKKYETLSLPKIGDDLDDLHAFSEVFFADIAEIYDVVTRVKNIERNPTGFDHNDAPILGLLVKISKIIREIVRYYKANDANIISFLDRQVVEAAIVARYLLMATPETILNYRKCSYKDRLRIYLAPENEGFFASKAGKRLKADVKRQFETEGFSAASFELQEKHRWKVDGKSVRDMFVSLGLDDLYNHIYGFTSESVHASWGHSMNFDLIENDDGTRSAYPMKLPTDIRYVAPIILLCNPAFVEWTNRVDVPEIGRLLVWLGKVNERLFHAFDHAYLPVDS